MANEQMGPERNKILSLANHDGKLYSLDITEIISGEYMGSIMLTGLIADCENEFRERMENYSIEELVEIFNFEQPKQVWISVRGRYLVALREAFLKSNYDCASFISETGMSLDYPVRISDGSVIQISETSR